VVLHDWWGRLRAFADGAIDGRPLLALASSRSTAFSRCTDGPLTHSVPKISGRLPPCQHVPHAPDASGAGVAVDTVERPRVSGPGSTRQDRSCGRAYLLSMHAMEAKTGGKQPAESRGCIGIIGTDCGRIRRGEGGHVRGRPQTPRIPKHCCVGQLM
jgi:hypothetical protein